ncbi:SAF domain-containing protein [Cellulomonas terrae]|nr:SAF domain-containing protein [Cellulomonas terrae]
MRYGLPSMTVNTSTSTPDGAQDRRRAREDRGLKPAGAAARADRLPPAPRERRPLLAAFAVLLIVGGAAAAGLLAVRSDTRVPVLVAARDIAVGQQITEDDVTTTPVASEGLLLIPADQKDLVLGQYADITVSAGQLLDTTMLIGTRTLQDGKVAVGASLAPGRMPASGLAAGDVVQLVQVSEGEGTVLVPDALVSSAASPDAATSGTSATTVTFIVDEADGARVAGVGAEGQLAAVLVTRGAPLDGED